MKIGIVCEGRSDYPAIEEFVGNSLRELGLAPVFKPLFPRMDNTRPGEGWSNVLNWLEANKPQSRIQRFFGGGLFQGALSVERLDAMLIHLDADILGNESFCRFVDARYGITTDCPDGEAERAAEISRVLHSALGREEMSEADNVRHVNAVAVEASETWCVAAFNGQPGEFEKLRGSALTNAFMKALERSEGRAPKDEYANTSKDFFRRQRFCRLVSSQSHRVYNSCECFRIAIDQLVELQTP